MAALTELDPRWVVADRTDGRNMNNWHWTERDCLKWAKEQLEELMCNQPLEEGCPVSTKGFDHCDGTVLLFNRKGKTGTVCNLDIRLKWAGKNAAGKKSKGKINVDEISQEAHEDGYDIYIELEDGDDEMRSIVKAKAPAFVAAKAAEFLKRLETHLNVQLAPSVKAESRAPTVTAAPAATADMKRTNSQLNAQAGVTSAEAEAQRKAKKAQAQKMAAEKAAAEAAHTLALGDVFRSVVGGELAGESEWALGSCGLRDSDLKEVLGALKQAKALTVLDLSGNSLTDRGVQSLCASLAVGAAPSLTEVRLAGNPLGDGVKALEGLAMMRKDIVFDVKA